MPFTAVQPDARLTSKLINPILSSVIETFAIMLDTRVERGELKRVTQNDDLHEVLALVGVTGRAKGTICLGFEYQSALNLVNRFIGEEARGLTLESLDALGELINIIGGSAKSKLDMGLNIGLPQVIENPEQPVEFPQQSKPMRVHFGSDLGPFCVDFGFIVRE